MTIELKIKNKHLSEEAKIIRFEERKLKARAKSQRENQYSKEADDTMKTFHSLNTHRRYDVRNENRATYLARAYIAGKPYSFVEAKRSQENEHMFQTKIVPRILAMANKYASEKTANIQMIQEWTKL